jgi:hypothetical protein
MKNVYKQIQERKKNAGTSTEDVTKMSSQATFIVARGLIAKS